MANDSTLKGAMKYGTLDYSYESKIKSSNGRERTSTKRFGISNFDDVLASNGIFPLKNSNWYNKCSRYGWIDPFDTDQVVKEFLFFTKPDLNIFQGNSIDSGLVDALQYNNFIYSVYQRKPEILGQLEQTVTDPDGSPNPFMFLLSNAVTSKLDLPGISAESQDSTPNIMGANIQYRGHSLKSDNGYDFSLSFHDTAYLEIYMLAKSYDEYMRMVKTGEAAPKKDHIVNHIIPEQFSIYKFLIGSDGETILYYAKLTGCYFTDVPRSDMGDPGMDGFKYSLSFHSQFVEDMNPVILTEFNTLAISKSNKIIGNENEYMKVINTNTGTINNKWSKYPRIISAGQNDSIYGPRVQRREVKRDYFLKWLK